jgi:hypothetical protein
MLCGWNDEFLCAKGIRLFDYARFAGALRERIGQCAQGVCAAARVEVEHVRNRYIRKEDLVARVLRKIRSVTETSNSMQPSSCGTICARTLSHTRRGVMR